MNLKEEKPAEQLEVGKWNKGEEVGNKGLLRE